MEQIACLFLDGSCDCIGRVQDVTGSLVFYFQAVIRKSIDVGLPGFISGHIGA